MRRAVLGVVLVLAWIALWGSASLANVVTGSAVAAAIVWWLPDGDAERRVVRPLAALRCAGAFVVDLVRSSLAVARLVLRPGEATAQGIVAVPIRPCSPGLVTLVADSITLTPGTLTVEVAEDPPTLYVHVLGLADPEAVRSEVWALQAAAIRAVGTPAERSALEEEGSWSS